MKTKEQLLSDELKINGCKIRLAKIQLERLQGGRERILRAMAQTVIRELQAGVSL